jgi:GTP pyrophosphokinase
VPLEYRLQNGDIVSILTSKNQKGPSRDWLKIVGSASAKRKIRIWLKKEFRDEYVSSGEREFVETFLKLGGDRETEKTFKTAAFGSKVKELGFPSIEELYAGIGAGEVRPQQVIGKLFPDLVTRSVPKQPKGGPARKAEKARQQRPTHHRRRPRRRIDKNVALLQSDSRRRDNRLYNTWAWRDRA